MVTYLSIVRFDGRILTKLSVCVLIVNIVANAYELLSSVCACDQNNSNTHSITLRY